VKVDTLVLFLILGGMLSGFSYIVESLHPWNKPNLIISTDVEKAFGKIQHLFMIKTLQKMSIEGTYLSILKAICDKPTANITLNSEKPESIPPKIRNKTSVSTFTTIIQHSSGSPRYNNQRRKINKRNPDQKKRSKALTVCR